MATKQNMYVGEMAEAEKMVEEINACIVAWKLNEDGIKEIAIWRPDDAAAIRDQVSRMQGRLEILLKGLDKNSSKRSEYETLKNYCDTFMSTCKRLDERGN